MAPSVFRYRQYLRQKWRLKTGNFSVSLAFMRVTSPRVSNAHKQYLYHMEALNEIPVGALPLHFGPFPVR